MAQDLTESAQGNVALVSRRQNYKPARAEPDLYAALDLGTNSCRMLIATPDAGHFRVIDAFAKSVRLGSGLERTGHLSRGSISRTLSALEICAEKLRKRNVHLARSVATEACRRARNSRDFLRMIRRETGLPVEIIDAEEEARLAVISCAPLVSQRTDQLLVVDIGGGSTELVWIDLEDVEPTERSRAIMRLGDGFDNPQPGGAVPG